MIAQPTPQVNISVIGQRVRLLKPMKCAGSNIILLAGHTGTVLEINQKTGDFMVDFGIAGHAQAVPKTATFFVMEAQ